MWKTVEKPSISFSNSGRTASGVTSRPVNPVPPVVMTTSMLVSAIHARTWARIASTSSLTMARAASSWPAVCDHLGQRVAGLVVGELARIRHRQHGDADGDERAVGVELGHGPTIAQPAEGKCGAPASLPALTGAQRLPHTIRWGARRQRIPDQIREPGDIVARSLSAQPRVEHTDRKKPKRGQGKPPNPRVAGQKLS